MQKTNNKLVTSRLSRNAYRWQASNEMYRDLFKNAADIIFFHGSIGPLSGWELCRGSRADDARKCSASSLSRSMLPASWESRL